MKKQLRFLMTAILAAACFLFPAAAQSPAGIGFSPIQVAGQEVCQRYVLEDTSAELLHLAVYDSAGSMIGFTVAAPETDGQEHELTLTARGEIASVRLFQTTADLIPVADAVTLYRAPVYLGSVICNKNNPTTALDLYLTDVDINFEGDMNEVEVLPGDVVDYYLNEDGSITAQVTHYTLAQVTSVGSTVKLNNGEYSISKEKFADFAYEKGDYVLVVLSDGKDEVLASEKAATVSGAVRAIKGKNQVKIGDTFYKNLTETEIKPKDEITAVLNKANQIVLVLEYTEPTPSTPSDPDTPSTPKPEPTVLSAVLLDESYIFYIKDNGTKTYTYPVFIGGDERELTFLTPLDLTAGDTFTYTLNKFGQAVFVEKTST